MATAPSARRALVTGAAGFIGSHVVRALLASGVEVRALHLPGEPLDNLDGLPVERVPADVTDAGAVARAVRGCELVFHLAAVYALWLPDPDLLRAVNVEGTATVLAAARRAGVRRVVYTSSIARFGGQGRDRDATEASPFAFTGEAYARSKSEAHEVARSFAADGLDVTIVAPCGPIGPGDVRPTPTGRLLLTAARAPVIAVADTAVNVLDVRDCAAGHLLAAERGRAGVSYLLGNENLSLRQLAATALEVLGRSKPIVTVPFPLLDLAAASLEAVADRVTRRAPLISRGGVDCARRGLRADCARAFGELGLPRRPVADSIRDALRWWAERGRLARHEVRRVG